VVGGDRSGLGTWSWFDQRLNGLIRVASSHVSTSLVGYATPAASTIPGPPAPTVTHPRWVSSTTPTGTPC
jgi:hypothetical protein